MEQIGDFSAAADLYTRGANANPRQQSVRYFLYNNLGFCMNRLGQYHNAAAYSSIAIETDPRLHNAFKNLGLAREGLGWFHEAVEAYFAAAIRAPGDRRALARIEALHESQPWLFGEEQRELLEQCRQDSQRARGRLS